MRTRRAAGRSKKLLCQCYWLATDNPPGELKDLGIWFQATNIELHIGVEQPHEPTIRHTAFEVTDLEAASEYLKQNGVIIQKQRPIAGRKRFSFLDPFGNRMELLEYSISLI